MWFCAVLSLGAAVLADMGDLARLGTDKDAQKGLRIALREARRHGFASVTVAGVVFSAAASKLKADNGREAVVDDPGQQRPKTPSKNRKSKKQRQKEKEKLVQKHTTWSLAAASDVLAKNGLQVPVLCHAMWPNGPRSRLQRPAESRPAESLRPSQQQPSTWWWQQQCDEHQRQGQQPQQPQQQHDEPMLPVQITGQQRERSPASGNSPRSSAGALGGGKKKQPKQVNFDPAALRPG